MNRSCRHILVVAGGTWAVLLLASAAPLRGAVGEELELLDASLKPQRVRLVGLGGGQVSYFDQDRRLERRELNDLLRLSFRLGGTEFPALLELTDGQKLDGQFGGVDEAGRLVWVSPSCGRLAFELDRIAWFALPEGGEPPSVAAVPATDRITLGNGDALDGWVEKLSVAGLQVNHSGQKVDLAWNQVTRVELANPRRRPAGSYAHLRGGAMFRIENPLVEAGELRGGALGADRRWSLDQVIAIDQIGRFRLVPLWELRHEVTGGGEVFGLKWSRPVRDGAWHLHAPLSLKFELPAGTRRLALNGVLDGGEWSDLVIQIREGGQVLLDQPIQGPGSRVVVNAGLSARSGGSLELVLLEGANGPLQDRLVLEQAVVLVEERAGTGAGAPGAR